MGYDTKGKKLSKILQDIRTEGADSDQIIKALFSTLTGSIEAEEWSHQKCQFFYESVLRHYVDNEEDLELLLVVSGISLGYRSITDAIKRREKYLAYLEEIDSPSRHRGKDPEDTLRRAENKLLANVAKCLAADKDSGVLFQLIEKWTSSQAENAEKAGAVPPDNEPNTVPPQPPQPTKIHISNDTITNVTVHSQPRLNIQLYWLAIPTLLVFIGAVMLWVWFFRPATPLEDELPPVKEIFATDDEITLVPNERYKLLATVLPPEAIGADLSFVSLNTNVVIVRERDGWLQALENHEAGGVQTADIIIQAESGATTTKTVAVDFGQVGYDPPEESLDDFVPDFTTSQKIRVAGDTEWHNCVDTRVGDELEIQFEYRNTSEHEHVNVAVRNILPANLGYIPGSTTLYTTQTSTGLKKEDGIAGDGIYIGTYGSGSNACIRFSVRVVDINLAEGVTGLVNWSQACVNGVTLQDFATARVTK